MQGFVLYLALQILKESSSSYPTMDPSPIDESISPDVQQLVESLPKERGWSSNGERYHYLYKYQGFWYYPMEFEAILEAQKHFQAQDTDIILVTSPKSGTTWLKSLTFAIANRTRYPTSDKSHPLLTTNPHGLVPFFQFMYRDKNIPDISNLPSPRLFATHVSYSMFSESVRSSNCKVIYLCRNPKDTFVSLWIFMNNLTPSCFEKHPLEEAFDKFCNGVSIYGPFWDLTLEYWKLSLEKPEKVLFLKYEDMKGDIVSQVKKISEFVGCPFSSKEESEGVIEEIVKMCSFEHLSNLDVNKSNEKRALAISDNKNFFRKGQVGDWMNHLTPSMVERLDQIIGQKLQGSGLTLI